MEGESGARAASIDVQPESGFRKEFDFVHRCIFWSSFKIFFSSSFFLGMFMSDQR